MAVLTVAAFLSKYSTIFADNTTRAISEEDMRDFRQDIADSFQSVLGAVTITSWKSPCVVATTANITLSGEQTIDGVLTSTSRVLVKNQTTTSQNGIYVTAAGAWSRSTDADSAGELEGAAVAVTQGTVNQNTIWSQTTDSITLGSSAIAWQQVGYATTGIGGSTGSTDNLLLRSDGTGGSTLQASLTNLSDTGVMSVGTSTSFTKAFIIDPVSSPITIRGNITSGSIVDLDVIAPPGISGSTTGGDINVRAGNGFASGNTNGGDAYLTGGTKNGSGLNGNIGLHTTAGSFGSGEKVIFIANATTVPSTDPTGGGILYVEAGALKYRGSSGTVTTLGNA